MGTFIEVGKASEFKDGDMKKVLARGREVLIARVGDNYYAADNRCPHIGGNLSQGRLKGTIVTCPWHGSQFDLTDGRVVRWTDWPKLIATLGKILKSPKSLNIYTVRVEGDNILVEI